MRTRHPPLRLHWIFKRGMSPGGSCGRFRIKVNSAAAHPLGMIAIIAPAGVDLAQVGRAIWCYRFYRGRIDKMRHVTKPTFAELYVPKLITVLRDSYGAADFRADTIAGLTVAIVALPLSMAIAIGSGVTPDRGLYAAVIGGFIVSLLGGSRFQIRGGAGAFT